MNLNKIKEYPLHAFLVGFYFAVFVVNQNSQKLYLSMTYRTIFISILISGFVFFISKIFLKDRIKAGVFTTLLLFGLFTYGLYYNTIEQLYFDGNWPWANIHRYLVLAYVAICSSIYFIIHVSKLKWVAASNFLNVFIGILIVINLGELVVKEVSEGVMTLKPKNPFIEHASLDRLNIPSDDISPRPDIYYIILDGYGNEKILKKFFDYDNHEFIAFLKSNGFYVADESSTNYPSTRPSLSSSMNMEYIDSLQLRGTSVMNNSLISKNYVTYLLKNTGYTIVSVPSGYNVTNQNDFADRQFYLWGPNEFERSILRLTIFRLDDLTGFMAYFRLKNQFKILYEMSEEVSPKFCFIHLVCPHPPYVFNKKGGLMLHSISDIGWETKDDYIQQLQYINKVASDYISHILKTSKIKPMIILQSDHGPWMRDSLAENVYTARTKILNAYLLPDSIQKDLYPTISPVNSFRLIFNHFNPGKFPQLENIPPLKAAFFKDPVFSNYQIGGKKNEPQNTIGE